VTRTFDASFDEIIFHCAFGASKEACLKAGFQKNAFWHCLPDSSGNHFHFTIEGQIQENFANQAHADLIREPLIWEVLEKL
jgi:hypothetical protein